MRIKAITITNFKAFRNVRIECNETFNFIVGENNIGKSTILEAIQLWKKAYDTILRSDDRNFYGAGTLRYLRFEDLNFLRLSSVSDLFHTWGNTVSITLHFAHEAQDFNLKISLEKPRMLDTYLRVKRANSPDFQIFQTVARDLGLRLSGMIFIYQTKPIFNLTKNEPFYNSAQLLGKIALGKSFEVIRNKILRCRDGATGFRQLEERLNRVFNTGVTLKSKNRNPDDEEFVSITIKEHGKKEIDISLIGSGFLQVLEIFSTLQFISRAPHSLNILLIDEPDSHIHSNLQSNLIDELRRDVNTQSFIISHNERLVNKANETELFFVNQQSLNDGIISCLPNDSYSTVATELAGQLLGLNASERQKIIVITEGKTDKKILEVAWDKLSPGIECPFTFVSSGLDLDEERRTGNADTVRRTIELVSTISNDIKLIGLFDNDREGNEQYKSLSRVVFEPYAIENSYRKHLTKDIYGMLLKVPVFRQMFVTENNMLQRYFVIEHYFSDDLLTTNSMKGDGILGTDIFEITGSKSTFSNSVDALPSSEFANFEILFAEMISLFPS